MKPQVVSFHCVLKTKLGKVISSTFNHEVITVGTASDVVLKALVDGMQDLKKGEKRKISLSAEKAYGFYDPNKVVECNMDELASEKKIRRGDMVQILREEGGLTESLRVVSINGAHVVLDGNHPLAGQDLVFEIEATAAREATIEELDAGAWDGEALH